MSVEENAKMERVVRYSEALKHEVSKSIKGGMSYREAGAKYGIRSVSTMYGWVKNYGGVKKGSKMKVKQSNEAVHLSKVDTTKRELELALARMSLKVYCLETVIEEAGKYYQEDLKKKFSQQ